MAMLGFGLATLFRQSAMAMGLGPRVFAPGREPPLRPTRGLGDRVQAGSRSASDCKRQPPPTIFRSSLECGGLHGGQFRRDRRRASRLVLLAWSVVLAVGSAALTRVKAIT